MQEFLLGREKKVKNKVVVISVLLLVLAAMAAGAADIYICAETGLAVRAGDGSKAKPWKDLQVGLDKAAPGDTIYIAQGNYLGTSDRGFLEMTIPVNLKGGYNNDFSARDVLKFRTLVQPPASVNKTASGAASLQLGQIFGANKPLNIPAPGITIDGIIFDRGLSNAYHAKDGKPEGVETGMLLRPPTPGENGDIKGIITIERPILGFGAGTTGNLTIQNCVFANGGYYGIQGALRSGKLTIKNNVFVSNLMAALEISGDTGQSQFAYSTECEFANNTVLFSWSRLKDLGDMGYGYRYMTGVNTDVHHCIIGTSVLAGLDRTRVDTTPADAKKRKTGAEDNAFFLNRKGDLYIAVGAGAVKNVWAKEFEDFEELYKYERNIELSGDKMKGKINEAYLKGFLGMVYSSKEDYDPNSPANQFRQAMGMNQVATMTNKVDMFGNRYPLEDDLKLFGALEGYGAQTIKN
jgi:hypothetical protein